MERLPGHVPGFLVDDSVGLLRAEDRVFEAMLETGDAPGRIVEERGLKQTSDTGAIESVIAEVLAKNPGQLEQYRAGKEALFGFFVGQTMKSMGGKANPKVVNDLLRKALASG